MPHLPVEIIHGIAWALLPYGGQRLAPLATINRHWQGAIESILWRHIMITAADIKLFTLFCQTHARRQAVRQVTFKFKFFERPAEKQKGKVGKKIADNAAGHEKFLKDEDETGSVLGEKDKLSDMESGYEEYPGANDDAEQSLSTFQAEHDRFFHAVQNIWDIISCWNSRADVKSITIVVDGSSMYEHLGLAFQHQDVVDACLHAQDWLGNCPPLPTLPSVESFKMEPNSNTDVDLWTAVAGCAIAHSLPALKELDIRGYDVERQWEGVRRICREGKY